MDVLSLIENQAPGVAGHHAAKYETSFMLYLCPELVDIKQLHAAVGRHRRADQKSSTGSARIRRASVSPAWSASTRGARVGAGGAGNTERLLASSDRIARCKSSESKRYDATSTDTCL